MKPSRLLPFLIALLLMVPRAATAQDDAIIQSDRLGITFISSAEHASDETRYNQAKLLGAGWNRWPLYWQNVERSPGSFDWAAYDRLVANDVNHGFRINAILLGIPGSYNDNGSIHNLSAPVFSDGTDTPGGGKGINGQNHWARFVFEAVARYQPGGSFGHGVGVWEVWNEPDLMMFWSGGVEAYARLLKVTYLAAHQADADTQVMFGGLAYINPDVNDWLDATLAVLARDPQRGAHHWYMDLVAVHNYSNAWRSGWVVRRAQTVLNDYGLTRTIWLNESGLPVWDDYPGPTWTASIPEQRRWRGTAEQQAAFVIQSTAYAWASGADVVFFHQLYDDCGNQAAGSDFPPNDGVNSGDAHGLFRNERSAVCFRQSPLPGTARPAASAFHVLAQVFGAAPFGNGTVLDLDERGVVIAFDQPSRGERIYVLWNEGHERVNLDVPASGPGATLYSARNVDYFIQPTNRAYTIGLPAAPVDIAPEDDTAAVGGPPFILVEQIPGEFRPFDPSLIELQPFDPANNPLDTTGGANFGFPAQQVVPTPGSLIGSAIINIPLTTIAPTFEAQAVEASPTPILPTETPLARPTVDVAADTVAPVSFVVPLPIISPATFIVTWGARDESEVVNYVVWVSVNGSEWQPWLENTTQTQAQYTGESGNRYAFAVWAQDAAGNWSLNTQLSVQAETAIQ